MFIAPSIRFWLDPTSIKCIEGIILGAATVSFTFSQRIVRQKPAAFYEATSLFADLLRILRSKLYWASPATNRSKPKMENVI